MTKTKKRKPDRLSSLRFYFEVTKAVCSDSDQGMGRITNRAERPDMVGFWRGRLIR